MEIRKEQFQSPFKFLAPFDQSDNDIFFGREYEQDMLYHHVNKNRLVILYGLSGTGKTSLVKCGLANCFDVTDWLPFYIRRNQNINLSLRNLLTQSKSFRANSAEDSYNPVKIASAYGSSSSRGIPKELLTALKEALLDIGAGTEVGGTKEEVSKVLEDVFNVVSIIKQVNMLALRPVFLIFDQFEELLIAGSEKEKIEFIITLYVVLSSENSLSCNILLILREEYFAWLDRFEQFIPGFANRRLRIEPMRPGKIEEVILRSCESFNIKLENPGKNSQQIISLLSGKTGVSLPYLQVYLDQLWRDDFKRSFPDGWTGAGNPPLEFTTEEIEDFGKIQDVMDRFLSERKSAIQSKLKWLDKSAPDDLTGQVLDAFVTDEGTKLPVSYKKDGSQIRLLGTVPEYLRKLSGNSETAIWLTSCLQELEENRILRSDGDSYELAHDILADLIDKQRTNTQRRLNEVKRLIRNSYFEFQRTEEYLTARQVAIYEDAISQIKDLDSKLVKFFEDSRQFRKEEAERKLKEAERIAQEQRELRELAEEAKFIAQRKSRLAKRGNMIAMVLILICLIFIFLIFSQNKDLKNTRNEISNNINEINKKNVSLLNNQKIISAQRESLLKEVNNKTDLEIQQLQLHVETYKRAGENVIAKKLIEDKRDLLKKSYANYSANPDSLFEPFSRRLDLLLKSIADKGK